MAKSDDSDVNALAATRLRESRGRLEQVPEIAMDDDQTARLQKAKEHVDDLTAEMEALASSEVPDAG